MVYSVAWWRPADERVAPSRSQAFAHGVWIVLS